MIVASRVLFVAGTDTGVGKTVATAALATLVDSPYVLKPAQTGVQPGEAGDLDEVRRLAGDVPGHEGARLRAPLAPDSAARLEGVELPSLADQRDLVTGLAEDHTVLVEGAGGLLVRLGEGWTLLDLAAAVTRQGVEVAFVVVARAGLGTLNHATLTVTAIQQRDLPVAGLVIGSWPARPDLAAEQNLADLPSYTGVPLLGRIPEGAGRFGTTEFRAAAREWLAMP